MQAQQTVPQIGQKYPGFCCQGFDYEICLIFPNRPPEPVGYTEIWGVCRNPDCPKYDRQHGPADPYRGVNSCDLYDFEERLREVCTETYNWHCGAGHNADFEVCGNETCQRVKGIEARLGVADAAR